MNRDIRIDLSFLTHRKRKKLFSLLGAQGVLSLVDLWLKTAENRPKGILTAMDETDIALDAQWDGDPAKFCDALRDVGFLDRSEDGTYSIHDWQDHQPFAYFAEERSKRAREAAESRWTRRNPGHGCGGGNLKAGDQNANGMQPACDQHTKGNAPSPTPIPTPSPKKRKNIAASSDGFLALWEEYPPRNGKKSGKKQAWEEWMNLSPDESLQTLMIERIRAQKAHREKSLAKGEFAAEFPDLCRWIKKRRWEDEVQEVKPSKW
jgi:hypothetical protein